MFRPSLLSSLWWPQSSEISIRGLLLDHHMLAAISMHGHAPMLVPLIHAWSIIPKSKKYILFRQHHILMYVRNSSKKRKYLIVKLFGTRSCDGSLYVCCCRYNGCINSRDVHIMLPFLNLSRPRRNLIFLTKVRLQICNVKCRTNRTKVCRQLKFICIIIYFL